MNDALHDTLSISKRLKGAGMREPEAEAVAGAIHGSITDATAHLATKKDLDALRSDVTKDLVAMESRLEARISALESRLVWRLFLLFAGAAGLVLTIQRLFPP